MYNLKNIGLMIHFRRDFDDRYRNLETVLKFYRKETENLQIVIVNDDASLDKDMKDLCERFSCGGVFMENPGIYWRTKAFNEASKLLNSDYIIAGDTDVIVHPKHILTSIDAFELCENVGIVYPYNGMFVYLKNKVAEDFFSDQEITPIENLIDTLQPPNSFCETENFAVANTMSQGGMVIFRKSAFIKCNGYNSNFRGWGFEDNEIQFRFNKLGFISTRVNDPTAIAWHLPHASATREEHPFYENNKRHCDFVCFCKNLDELKKYIGGWAI